MKEKFKEIIGYEDIKHELEIICDMLENTAKYDDFGVHIKGGLILEGPPGTGKTTMAYSLMNATRRKIYICRKDASDGDFIKKLNKIFEEAQQDTPSVILLDDVDKYSEKKGDKAEEYVAIQTCIDNAKDFDVYVIATANKIDDLPESLLRSGRLGTHINVPFPKEEDADEIVDYYLHRYKVAENVHSLSLSHMLYGKSCATLETVVNNAATTAAFYREEQITMERLVDSCLDILYDAPKSGNIADKQLIEKVAYHEAGHALVAELLEPESVTVASVRISNGKDYGFVRYNRNSYKECTKEGVENRIKTSLAGKAATEIVYGEVDMGTVGDVGNAFNQTRNLVDDVCAFGFDSWVYCERDGPGVIYKNRERRVVYLMEQYYLDVKKLLTLNREKLEVFAKALIDKETLTYIDIQDLKKNW